MNLIRSESSVMKCGDIYGRYTVLGIYKASDGYQKYADVKCSCGSDPRFIQIGVLRNGEAKSCGCLHKEIVIKHDLSRHPIYNIWMGMKRRCYQKKDKRYPRYGGRGIKICERWLDVNNFILDMYPSYFKGLSIDRIDNDGDYSPENCRWATSRQQTRNYSKNVILEYNGKSMCIADWAENLKICYGTLSDRIRQGWSTEKALTTPVKTRLTI